MPEGAFYVFIDVSSAFGKTSEGGKIIGNSTDFATALLEERGVAVVTGSAFGADDYVRISYAISEEALKKGIEILCDFLRRTK